MLTDGVGGAKKKKKKRSSSTPPTVEARKAMMHHQQGVMAHVHGDADGAIAAFQRAIDAKPDFAYAYYRMGFVMEEVRRADCACTPIMSGVHPSSSQAMLRSAFAATA